jgi:hypothetical protein
MYSIVQFTILLGELIYCCPLSPPCTLPVSNWPCKIAMRDRFHGGACVDSRLMRSCTCSISSVLWLRRFKRTTIDQDTSEGPPTAISIRATAVPSSLLSTKSEARNSPRENMFPPVRGMQNIYIINSLVQRTVFTFKRLTKFKIKSNIQNFFWFSLFVTSWCQSRHNWKCVSILVFSYIWALW